ncbi:MAG: hypothetical protein ACFB0B_11135 [Thermonemataceae bacterium]
MKRIVLTLCICFLGSQLIAQGNTKVALLEGKNITTEYVDFTHLNNLVIALKRKEEQFKSSKKYAKYVFKHIQSNYLRDFQEYTLTENIFTNGVYNCVSATWLYAYIYEQLGFKTQIYEMENHVYLKLHLEKEILVESTMALEGFITNTREINNQQKVYKERQDSNFMKEIYLHQLTGLQFYNQAVKAYNQQAYAQAYEWLQQATQYYPCSRVEALITLTQFNLQESETRIASR